MKPTLTHMSRFDMKRMLKNNEVPDNTLIISINDTQKEVDEVDDLAWYNDNYTKHMSYYVFKDDNESFSINNAHNLLCDIEHYKNSVDNIIVHCFAGLSRSASVAKWVNDYLKLDMPKYNEYRQHNIHVYDILCKVSGVDNINNYYRRLEENDDH